MKHLSKLLILFLIGICSTSQAQDSLIMDVDPSQLESVFSDKYYSTIIDDTVYIYVVNDSSTNVIRRIPYDAKMMEDVRVLAKNQNKIELWIILVGVISLASLVLIIIKRE